MKKELRAALDALAPAAVADALGTDFIRLKPLPKGGNLLVIPGEVSFVRRRDAAAQYVCFVPNQQRNAFTVELGWSRDGSFPPVTMRPSHGPLDALERRPAHGFVRLSGFFSRLDPDWDATPIDALDPASSRRFVAFELTRPSPEVARAMIAPLLEDACARLREHAPGFFAHIDGA